MALVEFFIRNGVVLKTLSNVERFQNYDFIGRVNGETTSI